MPTATYSYYDTLNISPAATIEEIKTSFRTLAKKYHPDKNNNSPESKAQFIVLYNAYTILSDPQKRTEYDNYIKASSVFKTKSKADNRRDGRSLGGRKPA